MFRRLKKTGKLLLVALLATGTATGARAASITAQAQANVVKPLTFTSKQNLDFGTILLGAPGTSTVSLSMAGVLSCGAGLTCSGAPSPAIFNVAWLQGPGGADHRSRRPISPMRPMAARSDSRRSRRPA